MLSKTLIAILVIGIAALSTLVAVAQADEKKFEVGGQVSLIQVPTFTATPAGFTTDRVTNLGFGGRFGYNFSRYIGIEVEGSFFPRDRDLEGGKKIQGLFGAKIGKRFQRMGLFAKVRPGFVRFSRGNYQQTGGCIAVFPPPLACYRPTARTNFAFDLGGVAELYPSKNAIIRFDGGDTIVRFGTRTVAATNAANPFPGLVAVPRRSETRHNVQASLGFGWRF